MEHKWGRSLGLQYAMLIHSQKKNEKDEFESP